MGLAWRARLLDDSSRGQGRGVGQIARTALGCGLAVQADGAALCVGIRAHGDGEGAGGGGRGRAPAGPKPVWSGVLGLSGVRPACASGVWTVPGAKGRGVGQIAREAIGVGWRCRDTALHVASSKGHTETAKALVAAGADVHRQNIKGYGRGCVACGASLERVCPTTVPGGRGEASGRLLARQWAWDGGAGIRRFTLRR